MRFQERRSRITHAPDAATGHPRWTSGGHDFLESQAMVGGTVYVSSDNGTVDALIAGS